MTPRPNEPEPETTIVEDLAGLADDVAKMIVIAILLPTWMVALAGAAEWLRGF